MDDDLYTASSRLEAVAGLVLLFGFLWLCTKSKAAAAVGGVIAAGIVLMGVGCMAYLLAESVAAGKWLSAACLTVALLPFILMLALPVTAVLRAWQRRKSAKGKPPPLT